MKKYIFSSLFLAAAAHAYAGVGDTTVVSSHNKTQLSWYQAYDTLTTFPDSTHSYNRIMMEFELGKYACPGYNPNNPGEGTGQTGWCADWDYDVHILACKANGDTVELGRMITPYANSNMPRTPANWKHSYFFDVTDYYALLQDDVTIRIFYAGWSGGFTGTVKFHMIEGARNRNVLSMVPLWNDNFAYGDTAQSINDLIRAKQLIYPANAVAAEYKMFITGHGGDNNQNCAEFCSKWYQLNVNNQTFDKTNIWRDNCGENFLYPQSGTWIYDRANWCPGDLVHVNRHILTNRVNPGDTFTLDLDFENYRYAPQQASYKIAGTALFYDDYAVNNDVSIEAIVAPTNDMTYYRENPICNNPIIKVKNRGGSVITSLSFKYGIGNTNQTYTYTGNIASEAEVEITLPTLAAGSGNQFMVEIDNVNNVADENPYNNTASSTFTPTPNFEHGTILFQVKNIGNYTNNLTYKITDANNTVVFTKTLTGKGEESEDYLGLENGCYTLEVTSSMGAGLKFYNSFTAGYFRMLDNYQNGNTKYALPQYDLGNSSLAGNFGSGFKQQFNVTNSQALSTNTINNSTQLKVFPNPSNGKVNVEFKGNKSGDIIVYDALGKKVHQILNVSNKVQFDTDKWATGFYTVQLVIENQVNVVKLNVSK